MIAQTLAAHRAYWEEDLSLAEASAALGISRQRLHQRFRELGLPTRPRQSVILAERREQAVQALRAAYRGVPAGQGLARSLYDEMRRRTHPEWPSSEAIVTVLGDGRWPAALHQAGVPSVRQAAAERRGRIRGLWAEGLTIRQIAKRLGMTAPAVSAAVGQMRASGVHVPRRLEPPAVADPRARILTAFAEEVADKGYGEVTLRAVRARARVSNRIFYGLFGDMADCFVAAYDAAVRVLLEHVAGVVQRMPEPSPERARAALQAILETFAERPAFARMCLVEVAAAGPQALKRHASMVDAFVAMFDADNYPPTGRVRPRPPELVERKALIGGILWVVYGQIIAGQTEQLPELLPQLTHFLLAPFLGDQDAASVAGAHRRSGQRPTPPLNTDEHRDGADGGKLIARGGQLRRPRRRPGGLSEQRERILAAFAQEVADNGYGNVQISDVNRRAGASTRTFYDLFSDKADCFLAAYDRAIANLMQQVAAVYGRMPEPTPQRARAVLSTVLEVFAADPPLARMCLVEVAAAGPQALKRYLSMADRFIALLDGIEHYPPISHTRPRPPDAVARKALIGGILWVIYDRIIAGQTEHLPELLPQLTHFLLTPFLGEPEAAKVAHTQTQPRRRPTPAQGRRRRTPPPRASAPASP